MRLVVPIALACIRSWFIIPLLAFQYTGVGSSTRVILEMEALQLDELFKSEPA
jgi:hypothetical protein